jgi:hypothetical protein
MMISTAHLWLPIVLSAIGVFIASSLIHTVLKWHNSDYGKLGNEDEVRAAINRSSPAPGLYVVPHCLDGQQMQSPEIQKKFADGPVGFVIVRESGPPKMGPFLGKWFLLNLVVALIVGHLAGHALGGAPRHATFVFPAIVTFLAYGAGAVSDGIWMGRPWSAVAKDLLDASIYGLITGAIFVWLWPHA